MTGSLPTFSRSSTPAAESSSRSMKAERSTPSWSEASLPGRTARSTPTARPSPGSRILFGLPRLGCAATATPLPFAPASPPPPAIFSDAFSSGNFANWTGVTGLTIDAGTFGVAPPSAQGPDDSPDRLRLQEPLRHVLHDLHERERERHVARRKQSDPAPAADRGQRPDREGVRELRRASCTCAPTLRTSQIYSGVALGQRMAHHRGLRHGRALRDLGPVSGRCEDRERLGRRTPVRRRSVVWRSATRRRSRRRSTSTTSSSIRPPAIDTDPPTAPGKPTGRARPAGPSPSAGRPPRTRRLRSPTPSTATGASAGTTTSTSFTDTGLYPRLVSHLHGRCDR